MEEYLLSDLDPTPPGMARLRHGVMGRSPVRYVRRVAEVGFEVAVASVMDRLWPLKTEIRTTAGGVLPARRGSLALYLHWSPDGRISDMVIGQVAQWREAGFDVAFITNTTPPPADWEAIGTRATLRISRANAGRDFGGWRDGLAVALDRFGTPDELLLANDSVLGPIRPLAPVVDALRGGGEGLFGLTESRGGGAHLQSYVLLARGAGAVADVGAYLAASRPTRSKWRLVQQGEIGLSRHMMARGHRVAALFGYDRLAATADPRLLAQYGPRFTKPGALDRFPLNPAHHLWRMLVERFGFPYLKTELVLRNPGKLPGVEAWPDLVDERMQRLIDGHLRLMSQTA
jgi:hypothetical protein